MHVIKMLLSSSQLICFRTLFLSFPSSIMSLFVSLDWHHKHSRPHLIIHPIKFDSRKRVRERLYIPLSDHVCDHYCPNEPLVIENTQQHYDIAATITWWRHLERINKSRHKPAAMQKLAQSELVQKECSYKMQQTKYLKRTCYIARKLNYFWCWSSEIWS